MKKPPFISGLNIHSLSALVKWLPAILIILLAYQSAGLTWKIASYFRVDAPLPVFTSSSPQVSANQAGKTGLPDLSVMHLFGNAVEEASTTAPVEAPKTSLNLTLHGVFVDQDPSRSGAIIGTSGGNQKYFNQGQVVDSSAGVTLYEVRPDQVILFRGGRYESLRFPRTSVSNSTVFKPASTQTATGNGKISKRNVMENLRVVPVYGGASGLKGYRLLPKKDRAEYNRLGIRPTDIVVAINGISLKDQKEAMRVINELYKATSVEVQVDRNGTLETFTLDVTN